VAGAGAGAATGVGAAVGVTGVGAFGVGAAVGVTGAGAFGTVMFLVTEATTEATDGFMTRSAPVKLML
jgi:hypothetical protein